MISRLLSSMVFLSFPFEGGGNLIITSAKMEANDRSICCRLAKVGSGPIKCDCSSTGGERGVIGVPGVDGNGTSSLVIRASMNVKMVNDVL